MIEVVSDQETQIRRARRRMGCVRGELCARFVEIELLISEAKGHALIAEDLSTHAE